MLLWSSKAISPVVFLKDCIKFTWAYIIQSFNASIPSLFYSDLSLDIPSQFRQKRSKDQEPGPTCTLRGRFPTVRGNDSLDIFGNINTLYFSCFVLDCLHSFTDLEELDETELYYCHKCKKRQKSTKKFWIQKLPKVVQPLCLIIVLEQFTNLTLYFYESKEVGNMMCLV